MTERTREIGTRLAIGALEREVLLQFLIEAVVLSSLGGLLGIVLAMVTSVLLTAVLNVPFIFNGSIIIISFLFSAAVGVIFGYMPAKKAARLNPIDAFGMSSNANYAFAIKRRMVIGRRNIDR